MFYSVRLRGIAWHAACEDAGQAARQAIPLQPKSTKGKRLGAGRLPVAPPPTPRAPLRSFTLFPPRQAPPPETPQPLGSPPKKGTRRGVGPSRGGESAANCVGGRARRGKNSGQVLSQPPNPPSLGGRVGSASCSRTRHGADPPRKTSKPPTPQPPSPGGRVGSASGSRTRHGAKPPRTLPQK